MTGGVHGISADHFVDACNDGDIAFVRSVLDHSRLHTLNFGVGLLRASCKGHLEVVQELLSGKFENQTSCVDLNTVDECGRTALIHATLREDHAIIQTLLDKQADPSISDTVDSDTPKTVLHYACERGHLVLVESLCENMSRMTQRNGTTALMHAARYGQEASVKVLLAHTAEVNAVEPAFGRTALMMAARHRRSKVLEMLLRHVAIDVNLTDRSGRTALMLAACEGNADGVEILLSHEQLELNRVHRGGKTALYFALERGHEQSFSEIAVLLAARGACSLPERRDWLTASSRQQALFSGGSAAHHRAQDWLRDRRLPRSLEVALLDVGMLQGICDAVTRYTAPTYHEALGIVRRLYPQWWLSLAKPKEAEFQISIAKGSGEQWGMRLTMDTDCVKINELLPGAVVDWNEAHPDQQLSVGDEIRAVDGARGSSEDLHLALGDVDVKAHLTIFRFVPESVIDHEYSD